MKQAFILIFTFGVLGLYGQDSTVNYLSYLNLIEKSAPVISGKFLDGKSVNSIQSDNKTIILNFWFINCKWCRAEIPFLNKVKEDFVNVEIIGASIDSSKTLKKALVSPSNKKDSIVSQINYHILPDSKELAKKYSVYGYPTTFIIKQGKVRQVLSYTTEFNGKRWKKAYKGWKKKIKKIEKTQYNNS